MLWTEKVRAILSSIHHLDARYLQKCPKKNNNCWVSTLWVDSKQKRRRPHGTKTLTVSVQFVAWRMIVHIDFWSVPRFRQSETIMRHHVHWFRTCGKIGSIFRFRDITHRLHSYVLFSRWSNCRRYRYPYWRNLVIHFVFLRMEGHVFQHVRMQDLPLGRWYRTFLVRTPKKTHCWFIIHNQSDICIFSYISSGCGAGLPTVSRAELFAVLFAVKMTCKISEDVSAEFVTDAQYVCCIIKLIETGNHKQITP